MTDRDDAPAKPEPHYSPEELERFWWGEDGEEPIGPYHGRRKPRPGTKPGISNAERCRSWYRANAERERQRKRDEYRRRRRKA